MNAFPYFVEQCLYSGFKVLCFTLSPNKQIDCWVNVVQFQGRTQIPLGLCLKGHLA